MKRVHPSPAQSVPAHPLGVLDGQSKLVGCEDWRRARASAATVALALSVGASGALLPQRGNAAVPVVTGESSKSYHPIEHAVAPGETFWSIAKQYGISPDELAAFNHLNLKTVLVTGQIIRVPVSHPLVETVQPEEVAEVTELPQLEKMPVATVEAAETPESRPAIPEMEAIALPQIQPSPGTVSRPETEGELAEVTATLPVDDAIGEPIASKTQPIETRAVREVAPGETLYDIAAEYDIAVTDLTAANGIDDPDFIREGQSLTIPQLDADPNEETGVPTIVGWGSRPSHRQADPYPAEEIPLPNVALVDLKSMGPERPLSESALSPNELRRKPVVTPAVRAASEETRPQLETDSPYGAQMRANVTEVRRRYARVGDRPRYASTVETAEQTSVRQTQASIARLNPELIDPDSGQVRPVVARDRQTDGEAPEVAAAPIPYSQQLRVATGPSGAGIDATMPRTVSPELPAFPADPHRYLPDTPGLPDRLPPDVPVRDKPEFTGYIWPARGTLTSGYGWRWGRMHKGIDIAGPTGTPIVAAAPGVVTYARWNPGGYGNLVELTHPDGSQTLYAHNSRLLVREGQNVTQGEQIAEMGSTGFSTGPHLHFEIHPSGQGAVNPMAYLQ